MIINKILFLAIMQYPLMQYKIIYIELNIQRMNQFIFIVSITKSLLEFILMSD